MGISSCVHSWKPLKCAGFFLSDTAERWVRGKGWRRRRRMRRRKRRWMDKKWWRRDLSGGLQGGPTELSKHPPFRANRTSLWCDITNSHARMTVILIKKEKTAEWGRRPASSKMNHVRHNAVDLQLQWAGRCIHLEIRYCKRCWSHLTLEPNSSNEAAWLEEDLWPDFMLKPSGTYLCFLQKEDPQTHPFHRGTLWDICMYCWNVAAVDNTRDWQRWHVAQQYHRAITPLSVN